jgi:hypothetical protein
MRFTAILSYKYASDEASQDNCEECLAFCESNHNLPRAPFTVGFTVYAHLITIPVFFLLIKIV